MTAAADAARRMGARAGETFARTGVPTRCPFAGGRAELVEAWRRGYFAALR
jgi:hypothetical protein